MGETDFLVGGIVADSDGAEKEVTVAADVFGESLHGDINAVSESVEVDPGGPGVVEND